ncbi:MAG: LamG domain-containing protein [Bacteroidales bacterium]|nr:LamG domain-containing protein [Bacteroidales bacterium]
MKQFLNKALLGLAGLGLAATGLVGCADNSLYEVGAPADLQERIDAAASNQGSASNSSNSNDTRNPFVTISTTGYPVEPSVHIVGQEGPLHVVLPDGEEMDMEGIKWWDANNPATPNFALNDGETLEFTATMIGGNNTAYIVEVFNPSGAKDKKDYMTITGDMNFWTAEWTDQENWNNNNVTISDESLKQAFKDYRENEEVTIRVTRSGKDITVAFVSDVFRGDPKPVSISIKDAPKALELGSDDFWKTAVASINWDNNTTSEMKKEDLIISTTAPMDEDGKLTTLGMYTVTVSYNKTQKKGELTDAVSTSYIIEVTAAIKKIEVEKVEGATYIYTGDKINENDINVASYIKSVKGIAGTTKIDIPTAEYTAEVTNTSATEIEITVNYKGITFPFTIPAEKGAFKINVCGTNVDINATSIVGNGSFAKDDKFGIIFQNASTTPRSNYLLLPEDVLSHSAETKEMTITFWAKGDENTAHFSPIFSAYAGAPAANGTNGAPMFIMQTRGLLQVNNEGWCDFTAAQNVAGANIDANDETFHDGKWHLITCVLTETSAKYMVDGEVYNEWTVTGEGAGNVIAGLFSKGADLKYICLGGNQAWDWGDPDCNCAFANFAIYNQALSTAEIKAMME